MQEASGNSPISGPMMDPDIHTKVTPVKSYRCSQCSFVFASMISLCQHVTDVHGVKKKNAAAGEITTSGEIFSCQLCGLTTPSSDDLSEHEVNCKNTSEDENEIGDSTAAENHENEVGAITSTSKSACTLNSSKDLKTYKNPLQIQTISKYFALVSKPSGKTSVKTPESLSSLDGTKGTLLLQQSPSDPSQNSSGVFKVTAKIDMADTTDRCLLQDIWPGALEKDRKRSAPEQPQSCPVKIAKPGVLKMKPPKKESTGRRPSSSSDFSFEVSEDEEERTKALPNGDTGSPNLYFCKHCDYSDSVIRRMSFHYQNDHPYIRCSVTYIQDPRDHSVTFRCLECPIEFLGLADLEIHYNEIHPNSQKVFMMHSCDLGYKCFVCPFVTNDSRALKEHYWKEHPQHKADNSLLYCKYTVDKDESSQPDIRGKYPSPETSGRISPKNAKNAQHEEFQKAPLPEKSNSGEDVVSYHCGSCKFSHKSATGVHFHYMKHHPKEVVTMEEIRQTGTSHATTLRNPERSGKTTETSAAKRSTMTTESSTSKRSSTVTESSTSKRSSTITESSTSKRSSTVTESSTPPTTTERSTSKRSSTVTESSTSKRSSTIKERSTPPTITECSTSKRSSTITESSTPPTITEISTPKWSTPIMESSSPQRSATITESTTPATVMESSTPPTLTDSSTPKRSSAITESSSSKRSAAIMESSARPTITETSTPKWSTLLTESSTPTAMIESSTPKSSTTAESSTSKRSTTTRESSTPPTEIESSTSKKSSMMESSAPPMTTERSASKRSSTITESSTPQTRTETETSTSKMSGAIPESSVPQNNIPEAEEFKAKGQQQRDSVSAQELTISFDTSKLRSESPQMEKGKSAEHGKKTKPPSSKSNQEPSAGSSHSLEDKVFYCQFCTFSNVNIRSVVAHHNLKHAEQGLSSTEEVWWYNHKLPKKKMRRESETPTSAASSSSESKKGDEASQEKNLKKEMRKTVDTANSAANPYDFAENLFYCPRCNFGNVAIKGVMGHQAQSHPNSAVPQEDVLKYSTQIRAEIKKSKSDMGDSFSPSHLPLPILCRGDETCYFCHFCNFRNNSMTAVLGHFFKRHHGIVAKPHAIIDYTARLLKHMGVDPLKPSTGSGDGPASLGESKKKKMKKQKPESSSVSPSPSATAPQTERILKCYRCLYTTPVVNVLRRHMANIHGTSRSSLAILKLFYREGTIDAGYHCDACVFSHKSAAALYKHFQDQHPKRNYSLKQISTNLFVGPVTVSANIKNKVKTTPFGGDGADRTLLSQRPKQMRCRMYWCRACSFKGTSMWSVVNHCRAAHPWSVRDDGSYLNVITTKKQNANTMVGDEELAESLCSSQVALNHRGARGPSRDKFDCRDCPTSFDAEHELQAHFDRKHAGVPSTHTSEGLHVFKCPHCTYINSKYTGVVTHCQMRHSECESRAASHYLDDAQLQSWSGERSKFKGYLCQACPQICATPEKLLQHHGKEHRAALDTLVEAAYKRSPAKKQPHAYSSLGSLLKASFLNKKRHAKIKCSHCKYFASTKIGLESHMRMNHRSSSSSGPKDSPYKCALCPSSYMVKGHLKRHYTGKHGKQAYLKYFVPAYQRLQKSSDEPSTLWHEDTSESNATGSHQEMLVYKCPCCPYVNISFHGTLTHCQMMHPDIAVRADTLQTATVFASDPLQGSGVKGSNQRGYMCSECSQIHVSLFRLQIHSEKYHKQSEPAESEGADPSEKPPSTSEASKTKSSAVNATDGDHKISPATTPQLSAQNKDLLYQCNLCPHATTRRRYLQCHYKAIHKLDAYSRYKQLEKYNKRKSNISTKEGNVACKKCTDLFFDTSQLLIHHYRNYHSSDVRMDFTVLKKKTKKNKGLYRCDHCSDVLKGNCQLSFHLDRHREAMKANADAASSEVSRPDEPDEPLETEAAQRPIAEESREPEEPSPTLSPPRSPEREPREPREPRELEPIKHSCKQCGRSFMSLKGLRSHERGHVALASFEKLDNLSTSVIQANLNKLMIYKAGTLRPFLCKVCPYRTTVFGLWRSHFIRKHQDVILNDQVSDYKVHENTPMTKQEPLHFPVENSNFTKPEVEVEMNQSSLYLEPPDVQRQLNHYNSMIQNSPSANQQEAPLPGSHLLYCDFCSFSTTHLSSVRRHYINRHGRKMLKCKECEFLTGSRKTLAMHMEQGHSIFQPKPTNHSSLRCPFCLYQTKSKNSMIDHIDLHREERVVPIEVRRSKLSRFLQGVVFRCHKCTFSCGSPESLSSHMRKHDDVKPYKCRLCFFDCAQLGDLEAHLSDKHQVVRNHELVGQMNLDKLEARGSKIHAEEDMEEEENLQQQHGSEIDNIKIESVTSYLEVPHEARAADSAENYPAQKIILQVREARLRHKGEATHLRSGRHEASEEEMETDERRAAMRGGEGGGEMSTQPKDPAAEGSSAALDKTVDKRESIKLNFKVLQQRNIESRAEDKILRDILVLDGDGGSIHKTHKAPEQTERNGERKDLENVLSELLDEEHLITLAHIPTIRMNSEAKKDPAQEATGRSQEGIKCESLSPTSLPSCGQLTARREGNSGASPMNCKEEQASVHGSSDELTDPYGEMPVLENEYLKEAPFSPVRCKEEKEEEEEQERYGGVGQRHREDEATTHRDQTLRRERVEGGGVQEAGGPRVLKSEITAEDEASQKKLYRCELCGRSLTNDSDLKHHIMRHGM